MSKAEPSDLVRKRGAPVVVVLDPTGHALVDEDLSAMEAVEESVLS